MRYTAIIVLILLTSCSSNWHLKKAIQKDPTIIQQAVVKYHKDTIKVVSEGAKGDTVFQVVPEYRDTLIFSRPEFITKIITDTIRQEVEVFTECYPDTIYKEITVPQYIMQPKVEMDNWIDRIQKNSGKLFLLILLVVAVLLIIQYTLRR